MLVHGHSRASRLVMDFVLLGLTNRKLVVGQVGLSLHLELHCDRPACLCDELKREQIHIVSETFDVQKNRV